MKTPVEKYMIVAPTFYKYEKYCDALIELIDTTWPDHPPVVFFSDTRVSHPVRYPGIIRSTRSEWPHVVLNGCLQLKERFPSLTHVMLLNEEGFPVWNIDEARMKHFFDIAVSHQLSYMYFAAYDHTWSYEKEVNGECFAVTPPDYKYYTQLGTAIWRLDYLIQTCSKVISEGILSPWEIEYSRSAEEHLISNYKWPTVPDGIFKDGFVNPLIIPHLLKLPAIRIKRMLLWKYLKTRPQRLYRFSLRKMIGLANRLLRLGGQKQLVYPYRS